MTRHIEKVPTGVNEDVFGSLDSQTRFLSAVFLSYAVIIWWMLPNIEKHTELIRIMLVFVFIGGLARIYSLIL